MVFFYPAARLTFLMFFTVVGFRFVILFRLGNFFNHGQLWLFLFLDQGWFVNTDVQDMFEMPLQYLDGLVLGDGVNLWLVPPLSQF